MFRFNLNQQVESTMTTSHCLLGYLIPYGCRKFAHRQRWSRSAAAHVHESWAS